MTTEILTSLIHVYDAAMVLYRTTRTLTGDVLTPGSVISELLLVTDVIRSVCEEAACGDDQDCDWQHSRVRMVLEHDGLSAGEKAVWLMEKVCLAAHNFSKMLGL